MLTSNDWPVNLLLPRKLEFPTSTDTVLAPRGRGTLKGAVPWS